MHATHNGHLAALEVLLGRGADTEAEDANGYTSLMLSAFTDRSTVAEALLKKKAQVRVWMGKAGFCQRLHGAAVGGRWGGGGGDGSMLYSDSGKKKCPHWVLMLVSVRMSPGRRGGCCFRNAS